MREREENVIECVCACVQERGKCVSVCVCVCVSLLERECVNEREREM